MVHFFDQLPYLQTPRAVWPQCMEFFMNQSMNFFAAQADGTGGSLMSMLLMFGAMFAILYFVMIRPQQKQAKKQQELLASLKKGDEVILSSGIFGRIYSVEDRFITLEIGDKVRFKVLKQAVQALGGSTAQPGLAEEKK